MKRIVMAASLILGCSLYPINTLSKESEPMDTKPYQDSYYYGKNLSCSASEIEKENKNNLAPYYMVTEPFLNPVTRKSIKEVDNNLDYYWPVDENDRPVMDYDKDEAKLCNYYSQQSCDLGIWKSEGLSLDGAQEDCRFGSKCISSTKYHTGQDYIFEYHDGDQKNIVRQSGGRPVYAVNNGFVIASGKMNGSGHFVIIEHYANYPKQFRFNRPFEELYRDYEWFPDSTPNAPPVNVEKIYSYYLHLQGGHLTKGGKLPPKCRFVRKGEIIGYTYTYEQKKEEGYWSDPHLHFEIWTRLIEGDKGYVNWNGYDPANIITHRFLNGYADPQFFFDQTCQQTLCDVTDSKHKNFKEAIVTLSMLNIFSGYPDGAFRPDNPLNRAELTKIAILMGHRLRHKIKLPSVQGYHNDFKDIEEGEWYYDYIREAYEAGIIEGYSEDGKVLFKPSQTINMAEMLKIILTATAFITPPDEKAGKNWYIPYLDKAEELEIAPIYNEETSKFMSIDKDSAAQNVTRKEAAKALYDLEQAYNAGKY